MQAAAAGAAGLAVVAATGGGLSKPLSGQTTFAAGAKQYGGRYQIGAPFLPDSLDPHLSFSGGAYFPRIYNALVVQSSVMPEFFFFDLAEALETPDETTWIFHIRPGVTIAPNDMGVPERDMDGRDAFESFERIRSALGSLFINEWFESHEASANGNFYTIGTPGPYAWFLPRLGSLFHTIPPRELILQDPARMQTRGAGGGPFTVPNGAFAGGQRLSLNRNPNYYRSDLANNGAALPYIDGIDAYAIPGREARRAAFIDRQVYAYGALDGDEADELVNNYGVYEGADEPVLTFISFVMNVKRPPWDDPRVRKAAMHAINRQQYIDLVYQGDARANGLVHWPLGAYALPDSELEELQPFDPALSRQLIQDAGHDLPLKINVMFPGNSTIEEHNQHLPIFLEQMAEAGFDVNQDAQDFTTWLANYANKDYDSSLAINQIYDTPEIPLGFQHSVGPAGDNTFSNGLQDAAIDAAIDAANAVTDPEVLVDAIHDVQRQIYEAGPAFLPIVSPFSHMLYWNFVKNVPQGLGTAGLYLNDWWLDLEALALFGDVNCNGAVDSIDAALVLQQNAGLISALACQENGDVNLDGVVDSRDALLILQHVAGLLPGLPV